jgi:uncharacterized membrane-anchored protein YhcB (DUF1043 family)
MSDSQDGYDLFDRINKRFDELKDFYHDLDKKSDITLSRLEDHFEQDARNLENITRSLESVYKQLDVYNRELEIHIAGTMELKETNRLLREQISIERQSTDATIENLRSQMELQRKEVQSRMDSAEAPMKWISQTGNILRFIASLSAAGGIITIIAKLVQKYL